VTDTIDARTARASAGAGATTAGSKLKAAREAAGLSLDAVALQLKLAPRQVKALEDDDWPHLPGRTFIRGFARNYARFVRLDPDAVVALLPAADTAPAL
jgi:cytoskeleton protein RodZ